jgi:hypothetical protein
MGALLLDGTRKQLLAASFQLLAWFVAETGGEGLGTSECSEGVKK